MLLSNPLIVTISLMLNMRWIEQFFQKLAYGKILKKSYSTQRNFQSFNRLYKS